MSKLKEQQDANRQHDPYSNQDARDLLRRDNEATNDAYTGAGQDQAEKYANDPKNASSGIQATNRAEQVPNQYNWDESNNARSGGKQSRKISIRGLKKKSAAFAIGGGFLGISGLIVGLFSPALLLIQMSEVMNTKFNDQLAALDKRSTLILKKKLNTQTTSGFCNGKLTIKCKYRTLSKNQAKRLTAAGLVPIKDSGAIEGRGKPTAFRYNGEEISANQLLEKARNDPSLRSALRKGYNPSFAAWSDANAYKMLGRFGIKKSSSIDPSTDKKKMRQQLVDTSKGEVEGITNKRLRGFDDKDSPVDDGAATYFTSDDGTEYRGDDVAEARRINTLIDEAAGRGALASSLGKVALKNGVKSVLTSTALGAGAVDSLCTAWTLVRVAGFAAKVYQQRQLIRYSYEFQKQADMVRAGDGKAELSTFFSDILTNTNANGKAATDSLGYMWAAYGDTFKPGEFDVKKGSYSDEEAEKLSGDVELQNESSRYVNGQLISTSLMADLAGKVSNGGGGVDAADNTCKFVKSWKGQALIVATALAGAVAAVFSLGTSITLGTVLNGAAGITVSVIFALLQPKLIDMAKGEVIKGDENGNEAGNAIVSGAGGLNAQASQTRGLPAQTKEDYLAYNGLSREVAADYNEVDRYESSPFDPTSKNTFVGSIMASIVPSIANSKSFGGGVLNLSSLITSTTASLVSPRAGAEEMTLNQVSQCDDNEYKKYDLAADPFCNVRYGMSAADLSIDPESVTDFMVKDGYIAGDDDPTPTPEREYEKYIATCIERETSLGDDQTALDGQGDGGGDEGKECIDGKSGDNERRNTMFRLFYIDTSIDEGMDSDFNAGNPTNEDLEDFDALKVASYNIRATDLGGSVEKTKKAAELMKERGVGIFGAQEVRTVQFNAIKSTGYAGKLTTPDGRAIFWNNKMFTPGRFGQFLTSKDGIRKPMLWVELKSSSSSIYVFNIHAQVGAGSAGIREQNARETVAAIQNLVGSSDTPVILVGDMNSNYLDRKEVYNILTQKLDLAFDKTQNRTGADCDTIPAKAPPRQECKRKPFGSHADQIYVSKNSGITVDAWENIATDQTLKISDHNPVIATLTIPGFASGSDATTGSDVQGDDYAQECSSYLSGSDCTGQCVGFVKFRLVKHGVINARSLGNGGSVTNTLGRLGFKVDGIPAVNSVFSTSATSTPSVGHTGMVSGVNPDGSIVVEEYNWALPEGYGTRTLTKAQYTAAGFSFAHTESKYK